MEKLNGDKRSRVFCICVGDEEKKVLYFRPKNFIEIPAEVESKLIAQEQLGHTAILAAIDGRTFNISSKKYFFKEKKLISTKNYCQKENSC